MRSFHKIIFAFVILLYTSCAEESSDTKVDTTLPDSSRVIQKVGDTALQVFTSAVDTTGEKYPELLLNWEKHLQSLGVKFDLDNFYASSQHDISLNSWNPWDREVSINYSASRDTSFYAYTISGWGDGEPDTYLYLIDVKKSREITLEVWGTCSSFEDAGWANENTVVTYGYETCSPEAKYPDKKLYAGFYALYNLETMVATYYGSKNFFSLDLDR